MDPGRQIPSDIFRYEQFEHQNVANTMENEMFELQHVANCKEKGQNSRSKTKNHKTAESQWPLLTAREPHGIVGSKSSAELRKVTVANDSWSSSVVKQSCNPTWSDEDVHDFVVTRIRWTWNMLARDILELGIVGVIFFSEIRWNWSDFWRVKVFITLWSEEKSTVFLAQGLRLKVSTDGSVGRETLYFCCTGASMEKHHPFRSMILRYFHIFPQNVGIFHVKWPEGHSLCQSKCWNAGLILRFLTRISTFG